MKRNIYLILSVCLILLFAGCNKGADPVVEAEVKAESTKILFIGTSHTYYNNMTKMVMDIGEKNNKKIETTMLASGGQPLIWHFEQENTRFNILSGDYDYIILQNAAHPFWKWELDEGLEKMNSLIDQTDSKVILFMTWAEKTIPEEYQAIKEGFDEASERTGYPLAPVGKFFKDLTENFPEYDVYDEDGNHASEFGSFVTANVIYETIFSDVNQLSSTSIIENYKEYKN